MDNPTRWNITNSAQNIVSALVDPSKQYDHVFRREWSNSFSGFSRHKPSITKTKPDPELKAKLSLYISKLDERKHIKKIEAEREAKLREQESVSREQQNRISVPEVFLIENFDLSNLDIFERVMASAPTSKKEDDNSCPRNQDKILNNRNSNKLSCGANDAIDDDCDDDEQYLKQGQLYMMYNKPYASKARMFTKNQLKELQQGLTDYLDIIEERLSSQISNRSGDFFQVMSSVDSVMDELSLAIKSVTSLRRKCSKLNDALILPNMKNIQLNKTRNNAQEVLLKMKEISKLCKVQPMIQLLLSTSDFSGALDLIAKSRATLNKEFTRVVCLKHLESQLVEYERVIATLMHQELVRAEQFVNKFHEERKRRIESNLDLEQWKTVEDVPKDFQSLITMLVDECVSINDIFSTDNQQPQYTLNSEQDQHHHHHHSRNSSDVSAVDDLSGERSMKNRSKESIIQAATAKQTVIATSHSESNLHSTRFNNNQLTTSGNKLSHVIAAGSTYVIVNSVINLVRIIIDYCKCAYDIRSLSDELLERLFTILQLYNSKTYHLVYSAGAIQIAGLKTITTRSLVVSQRSLKLIILLIPAVHRHFSQLLPDYNRLKRFDEIKLSYEDHADKITEKMNTIVKDVIDLQLQEWEAKPPVPSPQFTAIAQYLMRLHDNIQDALPVDEFRARFLEFSQTFKDVLLVHLRRLNISNEAGPQQWLVMQELTFYKISSSKLGIFKELELNFDDVWTKLNSGSENPNKGGDSSKPVMEHH